MKEGEEAELCKIEPPQDPRELLKHLEVCPKRHAWLVFGAPVPPYGLRRAPAKLLGK